MDELSDGERRSLSSPTPAPSRLHLLPGVEGSVSVVAGIRPHVRGKFIFVGQEKFYIRGVTYGAFRPDENGKEYHKGEVIERDFAQMAANGLNAVRIPHTVPPRSLLDAAQQCGLRVMVGLSAEQYVSYLIDKKNAPDIEELVRSKVRPIAGHPAVLFYAIGNEIPASIVRWLGRRRVEQYLGQLYRAVKAEDPDGLVTYVNYPTTEYLQLPFLDLVCFNVYLESQERLEAYLARLQNLAGDRPLVMTEIGLDSLRHGEDTQARVLDWQIRTTFTAGSAGAFVFTWTDEWYRAGADVDDWAFGLTDRDRHPKPALSAVRLAFSEAPFPNDRACPRISVVVCSYNGSRTIQDTLEGLEKLEYPDYEVIVIDDGSKDETAAIAANFRVRLIRTENCGLANGRNAGLEAATGDIVAYIDDDARPDPNWLAYLAATLSRTNHAGVGGPNLSPPGDGPIADCVANAPGGPIHVLVSDEEAEHIPGCNMAFRKSALQAIGAFDPQFRVAGDDVDLCWRLREKGWTLGFSPAAVVWHHRRNSVQGYLKQQLNYGKAEAILERKWPSKYNGAGQPRWAGRVYGNGLRRWLDPRRSRIYHGIWGSAPFQSLYRPEPTFFGSLPLMPEWWLLIGLLAALSALGALWKPLLLALPLLSLAGGLALVQAGLSAAQTSFVSARGSPPAQLKLRSLTALLYLLQPLARLLGRMSYGLTPWRRRGARGFLLPWPRTTRVWRERWQAPDRWLRSVEGAVLADGYAVLRGGDYDRWDLYVRGGAFGAVRIRMAIEDHGAGRQLVRFRVWPEFRPRRIALTLLFAALSAGAAYDEAWAACGILGGTALLLAARTVLDCGNAMAAVVRGLKRAETREG